MAIQAVFFDVVGTVLYPDPPPPAAYAAIAAELGIPCDRQQLAERYRRSFARQEGLDRLSGLHTDETRERLRWREIVAEVFDHHPQSLQAFERLWHHFAQPAAWRWYDDVADCWTALCERGLRIGLASNFDRRLRGIVACRTTFAIAPDFLAISSEIGWRKPAPQFFAAIEAMTGLAANQILIVGDDQENDYDSARRAGMAAILLDRDGPAPAPPAIGGLRQLPDTLAALSIDDHEPQPR